MHWPEVLGTLAGDNTVLLIIRSNEETITVTHNVQPFAEFQTQFLNQRDIPHSHG